MGTIPCERYSANGWSPALLHDVPAGRADLDVALKRKDDPRDVGDHMAEIHGGLRDAVTGEVLPVESYNVRVKRVPDVDAATLRRDLAFDLVRPFMGQVWAGNEPPGDFHETGLRPGRYVLVASRAGYATALAGPYELDRGQVIEGVVIENGNLRYRTFFIILLRIVT